MSSRRALAACLVCLPALASAEPVAPSDSRADLGVLLLARTTSDFRPIMGTRVRSNIRLWRASRVMLGLAPEIGVEAPTGSNSLSAPNATFFPIGLRFSLDVLAGPVALGPFVSGVVRPASVADADDDINRITPRPGFSAGFGAGGSLRWFTRYGIVVMDLGFETGTIRTNGINATLGGFQYAFGWAMPL